MPADGAAADIDVHVDTLEAEVAMLDVLAPAPARTIDIRAPAPVVASPSPPRCRARVSAGHVCRDAGTVRMLPTVRDERGARSSFVSPSI